jgi:hypothetical protein
MTGAGLPRRELVTWNRSPVPPFLWFDDMRESAMKASWLALSRRRVPKSKGLVESGRDHNE